MSTGERCGHLPTLEHATSLLLGTESHVVVAISLILVCDVELLVVTLLVDFHDVLLSLLHKHSPNIQHVPQVSSLLNFVGDVRVLREDVFLQELLGERVGTDLVDGHVYEL